MNYDKHKYWGFLGLLSLIGLKGLTGGSEWWMLFFVNYIWFSLFYENSLFYKMKKVAAGDR